MNSGIKAQKIKRSKNKVVSPYTKKNAGADKNLPQQEVLHALEELPPEQQKKIIATFTRTQFYSGPIPPASEIAKYKEVMPDAPDRIFKMAEKEQERNIFITRRFDAYKSRGQYCALAVVLGAYVLTGGLALIGHPYVGLVISGGALVSVVGAFIYGNRKEIRENKDKKEKEK